MSRCLPLPGPILSQLPITFDQFSLIAAGMHALALLGFVIFLPKVRWGMSTRTNTRLSHTLTSLPCCIVVSQRASRCPRQATRRARGYNT